MVFRLLPVAFLVLMSASAQGASKEVRDAIKGYKIADQAKDCEAKVAKDCGCRISISVDQDSFKTSADTGHLGKLIGRFCDMAHTYCSDADSKKELCSAFTSVKIGYAADGALDAKLNGKTLMIFANKEHNSSSDDMKKLIVSK